MTSNIQQHKLGEYCDFQEGYVNPSQHHPEYFDGNIKWVRAVDLNNGFVYDTTRTLTDLGFKSAGKSALLFEPNTIVISKSGTIGRLGIIKDYMCGNRATINIRPKKNCDLYFAFYFLRSIQQQLGDLAVGSVQKNLYVSILENISVNFPPIEMQRDIGRLLLTFDKKIDCNNKINDNLQQQAQTVFNDWFVSFTPFGSEDYITSPIGTKIPKSLQMHQIANIPHVLETGRRPKGGASLSGVPSVGAENVKQLGRFDFSSNKFIPVEFAKKQKTGKITGYELLLYKDGGKPGTFVPHFSMFGEGFPYDDFFINEHVFKLDFFNRGKNEFAYFYMQTDYATEWLANNGGKAAVPGINQQDVRAIWIYDFDNPQVQRFCEWVQPFFKTIFSNCRENVHLAKLRDTLLPKLMSGEIDVSTICI